MLDKAGQHISDNWPVLFRALLYFAIGFLAPFTEKIVRVLMDDKWPTGPRLVLGLLSGTLAGLTAVRAYYDGSAQRDSDEKRRSRDTAFLTRADQGTNPKP